MTYPERNSANQWGSVWIAYHRQSVVTIGLKQALEGRARVYGGSKPPPEPPSSIVLCSDDAEKTSEGVKRLTTEYPDAAVVVFSLQMNLSVALAGLRSGARGFVHAGMSPEQIARAVEVAAEGEMVAPRKLLEYLITNEERADLGALSVRQREILGLVVEGLSNAEIGKRLYLSESTIKQHLRAAYKVLGVSNRTEAARLLRDSG